MNLANKVKRMLEDVDFSDKVVLTKYYIYERPNNVSDIVIDYPEGKSTQISLNKNVEDSYLWLKEKYPGCAENTTITYMNGVKSSVNA